MPKTWIDQKTAVIADSVYCDNKLCARDVAVTLPEIGFATADVQAMGTMTAAVVGLINDMTASISKVGIDKAMFSLFSPGKHSFEVRGVQNSMSADGTSSPEGFKAFLSGMIATIPGLSVTPGSASENEISITVTRYQLYIGGEEMLCIDRLNGICRILGVDYYEQIAALL